MLRFVTTANGEEYYELNKDQPGVVLTSKNHTGGLDGLEDHPDGKIFSEANSRKCPVKVLKVFLSHLNPNHEALFQRPKNASAAKLIRQLTPSGTMHAKLVTTRLKICFVK